MPSYPYLTEPTHDQGVVTNASGNAARDTAVSSAEGRLIVDAVDKVFLLEAKLIGLPRGDMGYKLGMK